MCGFIGKISNTNINIENLIECNKKIICRGPDNTTVFESRKSQLNFNSRKNYSFIFNRLSILDLTELANQPMYSKEFNSLILFNGEIFNHQKLRKELISKGLKFKTKNSDTEVLLLGISYYGKKYLNKLIGQFSIVFIDFSNNRLFMAKDRFSQKPLFYKLNPDELVFGSNLESIFGITDNNKISDENLNEYIQSNVIKSPNTIFENIFKLRPSEIIEIDIGEKIKIVDKSIYWEIDNYVNEKKFDKDEFYKLMFDAIHIRNRADVDIASFCSGGIDSTAIIKALNETNENINTFTVKFKNKKYDESQWSNQVAKKYNTNHFVEVLDSNIKLQEIDNIINDLDELYGDPSLIPTYIISKVMSEKYKVALSGDGGDELFGGYIHFNKLINNKKYNQNLISQIYKFYNPKKGSGTEILSRSSNLDIAHSSYFNDYKLLELLGITKVKPFLSKDNVVENEKKYLQIRDYKFYLTEMMMLKVDRASMANSLEVRSPFVDHRLVEYILSHKLYENNIYSSKNLLKEFLSKDFSKEFLFREKKGFAFDVENWVNINKETVQEAFFYGSYIKKYNKKIFQELNQYKSRINGIRIWKLFLLEKYLERF